MLLCRVPATRRARSAPFSSMISPMWTTMRKRRRTTCVLGGGRALGDLDPSCCMKHQQQGPLSLCTACLLLASSAVLFRSCTHATAHARVHAPSPATHARLCCNGSTVCSSVCHRCALSGMPYARTRVYTYFVLGGQQVQYAQCTHHTPGHPHTRACLHSTGGGRGLERCP